MNNVFDVLNEEKIEEERRTRKENDEQEERKKEVDEEERLANEWFEVSLDYPSHSLFFYLRESSLALPIQSMYL